MDRSIYVNRMTLKKEGTIGAYTLGSVGFVDGGTIGSSVVEAHLGLGMR